MDSQMTQAVIKAFVKEVIDRLDQAASVAKAAQACADTGNVDKAVEIALDIEQPMYEANTLLNAASLISRIGERGSR